MARQFTSGTATDGGGSVVTNMANLQATLRTIITANAAWTLVETVNGSTNVVDVYKCAAASSGLSKDFYIAVVRVISSGQLLFYMGEDYNSSTHIMSNLAAAWNASARAVDATTGLFNPANTMTINVTTGNLTFSGATSQNSNQAGAATMTYAVIVDTDHIMIRTATSSRYLGALESLVTTVSDPMPLAMITLSGTGTVSTSNSGAPRNPGIAAAGVGQTHAFNDALSTIGNVDLYPNPGLKDITVSDPWVGGPAAYDIGAVNTSAGNVGNIRGRLKKTKKLYAPAAGTAVGDTFTIAGRAWQVVAVNGTTSALLVDPGP